MRRRRGIEHRRLGECSTPYSTNHNTMKANTSREASSNEPKMMKNTLNTISPIISLPSNSSNRHLTPPFTRPARTPSMNHFRRSFRTDTQSTSSPISLLPIRQIDPYASSMLLLCISALLPMIGIEMGSTTIQISRFYLPHDQIDYPLVDVRTTKKSLTSQLRRWKPQSNPTVLFCISHAFPTDAPRQFNNSFHPRNNDPSTANQINSIPYVPPLLLRLHASNASNASPFHIDPSKPTPIHASHGICPFLFNIPLNTAYLCESSLSTTPLLFSSQLPSTGVPPHSHSLRKEPRKRERCN